MTAVLYSRNEHALIGPAPSADSDGAILAAIAAAKAKCERGERLTAADRRALWVDRMCAAGDELQPDIDARRLSPVVTRILTEIAASAIGAAARADELEARLAALEAAVKPRIRVPALSRPMSS